MKEVPVPEYVYQAVKRLEEGKEVVVKIHLHGKPDGPVCLRTGKAPLVKCILQFTSEGKRSNNGVSVRVKKI